jgi:hypothetical protein
MIGESAVKFSPPVYFLHFTPQVLSFLFHYLFLVLFLFLTATNLLKFCLYILLLVLLTGVLVFKFGGLPGFSHLDVSLFSVMYFYTTH